MTRDIKTLVGILGIPEAIELQALIVEKGRSAILDRLGEPDQAARFLRTNLRSAYLFARLAVPSYLAQVLQSQVLFPPVDDARGPLIVGLIEAVKGELLNNNIFGRPGECHAHYHDAFEAYEAAIGDVEAVRAFDRLEGEIGFLKAIERSAWWSVGSMRHAKRMIACCQDPLALFIMMPANEDLAPRVYARALGSLPDEPRYAKMRTFLSRHVELDEGDHGPVTLEWLDWYMKNARPSEASVREATRKVTALFGGGAEAPP